MGFINPSLAETAGLEDENGNPTAPPAVEPEKVTIDDLPVGSVWEMGDKRRVVLGATEDGKVLVHQNDVETLGHFAPASFTGWSRTDAGGEAEQAREELRRLREAADALSMSARFANLGRVARGLSDGFDTLSARAVGASPGSVWDTITDARGLLSRLAAGHGMLEQLVRELGEAVSPADFAPAHQAIVATLAAEPADEATLFAAVQEATGEPIDQRTFTRALLGLVAIGWVNPPQVDNRLTLSDKARGALNE